MDPILVTGGNRSGTSWVGLMLCLSRELFLVWEPFNHLVPLPLLPVKHPLQRHYQRLLPEQEVQMRHYIRWKTRVEFIRNAGGEEGGRLSRTCSALGKIPGYFRGLIAPLYKDPIALMSAEWMATEFRARPVLMVRHPAAYVNSVRRLDWRTPVEDFLQQEHLMAALPAEMANAVRERGEDRPMPEHFDLEDACLCWNVFHTVIDRYRRDHPDWPVVRHEDLCADYRGGFRNLYDRLGLTWSNRVERELDAFCSNRNSVVQGSVIHEFHQDSAALPGLWQDAFGREDLERIHELTSRVSALFYSEESWGM